VDTMGFAFGLETLLTGNPEQVAELLPQKESSLVPVVTLVPGTRMDASLEGRRAAGDPSMLRTFLVGFDSPIPSERPTTTDHQKPRGILRRAIEPEPQHRLQHYGSPQLLDLLIPKPTDPNDMQPPGSTDRLDAVPHAGTHSETGFRESTESLLGGGDGIKAGKFVRLSGAIMTLAVIQTLWAASVSQDRKGSWH
jgi:hypothetical protein